MKNKRFWIILSWAAVFFWIGFIFYLSAQDGTKSGRFSMRVTAIVLGMVEKIIDLNLVEQELYLVEKIDYRVRASAHFIFYFVLGLLVVNGFSKSGFGRLKRILFAFIGCVAFAASDEFHQLFVVGRGAQIIDVLIDSAGAFAGIISYEIGDKIKDYKSKGR